MFKHLTSAAVVLALLGSADAFALTQQECDYAGQANGPCFGTEITFVPDTIKGSMEREEVAGKVDTAVRLWIDQVDRLCEETGSCRVSLRTDEGVQAMADWGLKSVSQDGDAIVVFTTLPSAWTTGPWWYVIKRDEGVIELNTKPMNARTAFALKDIIETYIYKLGIENRIQPRRGSLSGGGHIHIDVFSAFGAQPIKLLNFMTEIHDLGAWPLTDLSDTLKNAAPLSMLGATAREKYAAIVEKARRGGYPDNQWDSMINLANDIRNDIDDVSYTKQAKIRTINLARLQRYPQGAQVEQDSATIELRAFDTQTSWDVLYGTLQFLHDRIALTSPTTVTDYKKTSLGQDLGTEDSVWASDGDFDKSNATAIAKNFMKYVYDSCSGAGDKQKQWEAWIERMSILKKYIGSKRISSATVIPRVRRNQKPQPPKKLPWE